MSLGLRLGILEELTVAQLVKKSFSFHGSESSLTWRALWHGRNQSTFRRNLLSLSSGLKSILCKKAEHALEKKILAPKSKYTSTRAHGGTIFIVAIARVRNPSFAASTRIRPLVTWRQHPILPTWRDVTWSDATWLPSLRATSFRLSAT
jgi:hypothetical protein